jgi:T5orf172 domain
MKFSSHNIWHDIETFDVSKGLEFVPDKVFRFCLEDFICIWRESLNSTSDNRDKLSSIFNIDYFNSCTVLTNAISLKKLANTGFYDSSPKDRSGFIYIYTFEDNVLAGKYDEGILWWKTQRYETKLKIGRTEQHVFNRIKQQLDCKTAISEPPILLAVFWTRLVVQCEHKIHEDLAAKRLSDNTGQAAKGGVEWFKDKPTLVLPIVLKWVEYFSQVSLSPSQPYFIEIKKLLSS